MEHPLGKGNRRQKNEADLDSESDSSDPEMQMTFYPNGRNRQSRGYFLPINICPGQTEPYVLPGGVRNCPIEGCPAYKSNREFKPHWRLNEHMKTRHGWPRKHTQPNTDRRLNGLSHSRRNSESLPARTTRSSFQRRPSVESNDASVSSLSKRKHKDEEEEEEDDGTPAMQDSSLVEYSPSSRPRRDRRQTAKGKEMANSIAQLAAATTNRPSKRPRSSLSAHDAVATLHEDTSPRAADDASHANDEGFGTDGAMDFDSAGPSSQLASSKDHHKPEPTLDTALISMIMELIHELRLASNSNPGLVKSANDYAELVSKGLVRVNCRMSEQNAKTLMSCYQRLAERHNAHARIYSMQSSQLPPTSPEMVMGGPPPPFDPTRHSTRYSPPKAYTFVNDAPKDTSQRAARNAVSGLYKTRAPPPPVNAPPPPSSSVPKPIMLKLTMTPNKNSPTAP